MPLRKRPHAGILLAIPALMFLVGVALPFQSNAPIRSKLYQTSRARLALARSQGRQNFSVILASASGKNAEVAHAIVSLGGTISWRCDAVDYLRVTVPIDDVEAFAERSDVVSIDADDSVAVLSPPRLPAISVSTAAPLPEPRTTANEGPLLHPYRPGRELQTDALRATHPTYDGRGVTVAVVDGTPDFLLPELQYGKALDDTDVPKFVDIRTAQSPTSNNEFTPWLTTEPVQAVGKKFTVDGRTYTTPYDGTFRFAAVTDQSGYLYIAKEIDPDLHLARGEVFFGVLWDERSNTVWVDTKRNTDFSDERGLQDYALHHDYGTLAVKTTDPQARPTLGFVVQTDRASHRVALLFGDESHATGSVGSVAASREGSGRIEGIAPGARLYSIYSGTFDSSNIEAVIEAARNPAVDEIDLETSSAQSYAPHDGRFTESIIFERVIQRYNKPIFQPAGNEFGMTQVDEACGSPVVFCIGASENRDSYLTNVGIEVPHRDNLHIADSFGPTGTGALRPQFLAPSGWLSLSPGYRPGDGGVLKGVYNLPPGYTIFGGTSQATPTAAGAVAVLISAARQEHLAVTPERLMAAVSRSARYMPNLPAYVQGNGLIQIGSALQLLERWNTKPLMHLAFNAPVRTATSWSLAIPNRGTGLFEREGWIAGERGMRTIWVTRQDGGASLLPARIELVGNDGTFTSTGASNVWLPLDRPIPLTIGIAPRTPGAHSAIVRLRSPNGTILGETLATIVAGERFTPQNAYTFTRHLIIPRPGETQLFVTVPPGAQVLVFRVTAPRNVIEYNAHLPDSTGALNVSNNLLIGFPLLVGTRQDVFPHPQSGTWEFVFLDVSDVFKHETRYVHPTPVTVTASLIGVSVQGDSQGVFVHTTRALPPTLTITRQAAGVASYANIIRAGQQRIYGIRVPEGATGIGADVQTPAESFVNLYLFDCTKPSPKSCIIKTKAAEASSEQHLYYDRPTPGLWKLVVDGYVASKNGTQYRLQDYYLEGLPFGSLLDRRSVPTVTFGTLANDPHIWYQGIGEIKAREGLSPIIFDVQLLDKR